jgi:HEAT repeat protein
MAKGPVPADGARAKVPGGVRRPSQVVKLDGLDMVRRRQRLNTLLLARGCAIDPPADLKLDDVDRGLLVQIARERVSRTNPNLRRAAVSALGTIRHLDTAETLAQLAASEVENDSLRAAALVALAGASPALTPAVARRHVNDESPVVRQAAAIALARSGTPAAGTALTELVRAEKDAGVRLRAVEAAAELGIKLPVRVPKRPRRPAAPPVDRTRG